MLENKKKSSLIVPGLPGLAAGFLAAGEMVMEKWAQGTGQAKRDAGTVVRGTNPGSLRWGVRIK